SNGVPFTGAWIVGSGNLAADMYANVMAESTGRALATRLYEFTDDPGMKDMLSFMIARDTMHQQQWLAVLEELGGYEGVLPIPNSFPQAQENSEFNYTFLSTQKDGQPLTEGRWTQGPSLDGKGEYRQQVAEPLGGEPQLAPPVPQAYAQLEQGAQAAPADESGGKSVVGRVTDTLRGKE
ncbi:MAG: manganese catalase family protein, partial [Deinococcota bacterium]|nr:manganese catalase family protein [Deinococcota bacterium]